MTFRRQQWLLGVTCTLVVIVIWWLGWMDGADRVTADWRTRQFHRWTGGPSPDIVVIGIDDRARRDIGEWPWDRAVIARGVDELRMAGARTVAIDLLFESHRSAPGEAQPTIDDPSQPHEGTPRSSDQKLADAIKLHGGVVLPMRSVMETGSGPISEAPQAVRAASSQRFDDSIPAVWGLPRASVCIFPDPLFATSAARVGDVSISTSVADGVCRSLPLWVSHDDSIWPCLALAAVAQHLGVSTSELQVSSEATVVPSSPVRKAWTYASSGSSVCPITWPRGGSSWEGQFSSTGPIAAAREISVTAVLQPWLAEVSVRSNLASLDAALADASALNLGDFEPARRAVRELQAVPLDGPGWPALFKTVAELARPAAAEAADYLAFVGEVDVSKVPEHDASVIRRHRDIATKVPELLKQCEAAHDALGSARLRLRELVNDKLCFVGWTSTGAVADRVNTSLGPLTPGVYVHAALGSSILSGFQRTPAGWELGLGLTVALGLLGAFVAVRSNVALGPVMLVVVLGTWWFVVGAVLWDALWMIAPVTPPALAASTSWLAVMLHRLLIEQRLRRRTEQRFRSYVSPAVVDELVNNPSQDSMTPQQRDLSIMFCDVTGFTSIAERLGAEGTASFLSRYLGRMTDTLLRHGATIDKYLGDGIMAFWGAPIQDLRHARNACRSALAMMRAVDELNASAETSAGPISIRIGIASGDVMVGDFGNPPIRSSYTVLGDACNLAARLEQASKLLGVPILISARVRELAGDAFVYRPIGQVVVQGRTAPEFVFELVGSASPAGDTSEHPTSETSRSAMDVEKIQLTEQAIEAFATGSLDAAERAFQDLASRFHDQALALVYLSAIRRERSHSTPAGEIRVLRLTEN